MPAKKKTDAELLAEAELEDRLIKARLMGGLSWRKIEKQEKVNYETARRVVTKALTQKRREAASLTIEQHLTEDLERYRILIGEAWGGWLASKGAKRKHTSEISGKGAAQGKKKKAVQQDEAVPETPEALQEYKNKVLRWVDAGDRGFIDTIDQLMKSRNEALGLHEAVLGKGKAGGGLKRIELKQSIYIPGLGKLNDDQMTQFLRDIEARIDASSET